jgi:hypothetical protein
VFVSYSFGFAHVTKVPVAFITIGERDCPDLITAPLAPRRACGAVIIIGPIIIHKPFITLAAFTPMLVTVHALGTVFADPINVMASWLFAVPDHDVVFFIIGTYVLVPFLYAFWSIARALAEC